MRSIFTASSVLLVALTLATACTSRSGLPPLPGDGANAPGRAGAVPPEASVAAEPAVAPGQVSQGPISPSNPSTAIVDVNRSVPQALGLNSPPPSSFENSCSPQPYLFQSSAGYEAVRVKDCRNDQLLYLPTSAQARINGYFEDCQRRCGIR